MRPADVLKKVSDRTPGRRLPPTAIVVGKRFEKRLFDNGAAALLDPYVRHGRLTPQENAVVDMRALVPGTTPADIQQRIAETERLVQAKRKGDPAAPNVILGPRFELDLAGHVETIEPDFLVAADGDRMYRVGEVKSYVDRGGMTDPAKVTGACRQAAVGVVALQESVRRLGSASPETEVLAQVDLVLRFGATLQPTLRPMSVHGEVASLVETLAGLPGRLALAEQHVAAAGLTGGIDDLSVLQAIPNRLCQGCYEYCDLVSVCKDEAISRHDPVMLGDDARETLAAAGCVLRALALSRSTRVRPKDAAEAALQMQLREAAAVYHVALRNA